jgi:hypothetical protein
MAQYNAASTVSAWLKEIYADEIHNLIPEGVKLVKMVKFQAGEKEIGDKYVQPVALTHEFGFTVGSGAFSLNDHIAASYAEAQVEGKNLLLRTAVSYDAMSKASSTKKAFVKWSQQVVGNMTASFTKRLEILHFYGATGLGTVSALSDSSGTNVLTITTATWASGIWAGAEGMTLDAYTSTVKQNSTGALTVSAVDLTARTVTVTGANADTAAIDVGSVLYFRGHYGYEMNGLDKIITNTGTLYNISASDYALWKGNSYSAGSAKLTFKKIQAATALAVNKGLDEKVTCFVSASTYSDLNTDLAALRKMDGSYKQAKGDNGFESICFYGVNGEIEIVPTIYVKEGEAFIVPLSKLKRIGSSDVTMRMPGQSEDQLVLQLPSNAGYEMRLFSDQNLFCERPAHCVKITAIVNG